MNAHSHHNTHKTEIYAMVSCGHKKGEGGKSESFFVLAYAGAADAARLLDPDVKIEWHGPNAWDPVPEANAIRELIAQNVTAIIVSAADKKALNPAINEAIQAGIPVITFDADAPASERLSFVGTDNYQAGYLAGTTMADWLKEGDVAISTIRHVDNLEARIAGFKAAFTERAPKTNIYIIHNEKTLLVGEDGRRDHSSSHQNYTAILQAHPGIRGLFATFAAQGDGAVSAVRDLHLQNTVQILAFDVDEKTTRLIANGDIRGTVGQDSYLMGYVSMILAYYASHAPEMPTKEDSVWRITALAEFLNAHPDIPRNTATKLTRILFLLEETKDLSLPSSVNTNVEILGKDELLQILAQEVGDMRDSIQEKIIALQDEIEEHRRTEEKLAHESAMLRTIIDTSLDQIYAKNTQSQFLIANREVIRIVGAGTLDNLVGKTDFDFHPRELAEQYYADEQALFESRQPLVNHIEPIVDQETGDKKWLLTNKIPFCDAQGHVLGFVGLNRDITQIKKAEEELEQRNFELAAAYEEIRILNDQLQEENLRMTVELNIAKRLQEMILPPPEELQQIEELDIVGYMTPADEVGGDYYDVLKDHRAVHIGIGDVTGHGLESGVLMLMTQTAIRTLFEHGETDLMSCVRTLNRTIYKNARRMKADKALTLALINYQGGQLKLVGQHEEVLVVRKNGQVQRVDTMHLGFPIGLEEEIAQWVAETTVTLEPGDGIVLYTDGITEAENIDKEFYGIQRLCDVISENWNQSAEEIKRAAIADITGFIGEQKVYDDLTLIVLKQK